MTNTSQIIEKQNGLWTLQVGQREEALRVIESALISMGMSPASEFLRLPADKKATLAKKIANVFGYNNPNAAVTWKTAHKLIDGRENIFTPDDWDNYFPEVCRFGSKVSNANRLNFFPWRAVDLNKTGINTGLLEKYSCFAFFSIAHNDFNKLLLNEERKKYPNFRIEHELARELLMLRDVRSHKYDWTLMPDRQIIPLTGDETWKQRKALAPDGYELVTPKDVFIFIITSLLKGRLLNNCFRTRTNSVNTVRLVCERISDPISPIVVECEINQHNMAGTKFDLKYLTDCENKENLILPIKKSLPDYCRKAK